MANSPQDMQKVSLKAGPQFRFSAVKAPQIDTSFVKIASSALDTLEAKRIKEEKEQLEYLQTSFDNMGDELSTHAKAKVASTDGVNTVAAYGKEKDWLQQSLEKKLENVPDKFQPYVAQRIQRSLNRFDKGAVPYLYGQIKKTKDDAHKTKLANEIDYTVEGSGDPGFLENEGLANVEQAAERVAMTKYGEHPDLEVVPGVKAGDLIAHAKGVAVSEALRRSVESQITLGRLDLAQKTLISYSHRLTPADRQKALKLLETGMNSEQGRTGLTIAEHALQQYPDDLEKAQEKAAEMSPSDVVYTRAATIMDKRFAALKKQRQHQDEKLEAHINRRLHEGDGQFDIEAITKLSPDRQDKMWDRMSKYKGEKPNATDWNEYKKLRVAFTDSPDQAKNIDLYAVKHLLAPKEFNLFENWQTRLKGYDNAQARATQRSGDLMANTIIKKYAYDNMLVGDDEEKIHAIGQAEAIRLMDLDPKMSPRQFRRKMHEALDQNGMVEKNNDLKINLFGKEITIMKRDPVEEVADSLAPQAHPSVIAKIKERYPHWTDEQVQKQLANVERSGKIDITKPIK